MFGVLGVFARVTRVVCQAKGQLVKRKTLENIHVTAHALNRNRIAVKVGRKAVFRHTSSLSGSPKDA